MRRLLVLLLLLGLLLPWSAQAQPVLVNASSPLWRGLVLWYPVLPHLVGRTWYDLGPNRLPATMAGAWTWRGDPSGHFAGMVALDGTSYGTIPHAASFDFATTQPFTLSIWFQTTSTTTQSVFVKGFNANPWQGYWLEMTTSGAVTAWLSDATVNVLQRTTTATGFNDGRLHHAAWVYTGGNSPAAFAIYVDGVSQAMSDESTAPDIGVINNTVPLTLGANAAHDTNFVGRLSNALVFNRALSASEVLALAQMQAPDYGGLLLEEPLALIQTTPTVKRRVVIE